MTACASPRQIIGWLSRNERIGTLLCGVALGLLSLSAGQSLAEAALLMLMTTAAVAIALIDLRHRLVPDVLTSVIAITGLLYAFPNLLAVLTSGTIALALMLAFRWAMGLWLGDEALGLGDVKLLGVVAIWLGTEGTLHLIVFAGLSGILHGIRLERSAMTIPFGTHIALWLIGLVLWLSVLN